MTDFSKQGKRNRASGARFEKKVRDDLESKGWIVSRWGNNVEFTRLIPTKATKQAMDMLGAFGKIEEIEGKLIPAKSTRFRSNTHGFPDFIIHRFMVIKMPKKFKLMNDYDKYQVQGIECKSNGYLKPEEKEKCKWLIDNNIFSKILIAKKGTKRGEIIYDEFRH